MYSLFPMLNERSKTSMYLTLITQKEIAALAQKFRISKSAVVETAIRKLAFEEKVSSK